MAAPAGEKIPGLPKDRGSMEASHFSKLLDTDLGYPLSSVDLNNGSTNISKIPDVNKNISDNFEKQTGLYYNLNEFKAYIFKGKANLVETIYDTFNNTGSLTSSNIKELYSEAGFSQYVRIVPDKLLFNGKFSYSTEDLDKLTKSGIFGAIRNGAEGLNNISNVISGIGSMFDKKKNDDGTESEDAQGESEAVRALNEKLRDAKSAQVKDFPLYINRYKNIPYYTDYNMESLTSITFKFAFGQSRMFSALEEVVKPIVGLISVFNIKSSTQNFYSSSGVMPSKSQALTSMYASLFGGTRNDGTNTTGTIDNAAGTATTTTTTTGRGPRAKTTTTTTVAGAQTTVSGLFDKLAASFADMITTAAEDNDITGLFFRIGRFIMGPFVPTNIEWNFDFSRVDENGYPCIGDITFNGLKMVDMNPDYIKKSWGLFV